MIQTRRSHLASLLALGLAPRAVAARALAPHALAARTGRRVLVIGAGLAGLAAARDLGVAGAEVTVLEARDRIPGVPGSPLTAQADAAAILRPASRGSTLALDATGARIDLAAIHAEAEAIIAEARDLAGKAGQDLSLADAIGELGDWEDADAETRRLIRHVLAGSVEAACGGSWHEVSARHFDGSVAFKGAEMRFPGGHDQRVGTLARGLDIRTGQQVTGIAPDGAGVAVTLADGTGLTADHAVLTLPLGVLKAGGIAFGADLAAERKAAIAALGVGVLNTCWLRFDRMAWPADVDRIEWVGPEVGVWAQWRSLARSAAVPVLLAVHAGDQARAMENLSDAGQLAAADAALKAMFGPDFPAPVEARITRWSQDPFALGSTSFNAVGCTPDTRRALAGTDWDGRLVFADASTEPDDWGSAQGTLRSGRAAARALG